MTRPRDGRHIWDNQTCKSNPMIIIAEGSTPAKEEVPTS